MLKPNLRYDYAVKKQAVYPNVADLHRGKTRQSAPDVAEHSLGQVVAYLTVCEILANASTGADGVLWCERSGFCRCGFATLGFVSFNNLHGTGTIETTVSFLIHRKNRARGATAHATNCFQGKKIVIGCLTFLYFQFFF